MFLPRPVLVCAGVLLLLAGQRLDDTRAAQPAPRKPGPTIIVETVYRGASAQVAADTVARPIEQQINGTEKLLYVWSRCTGEGKVTIHARFQPGTDADTALRQVRDGVGRAARMLPAEATGVTLRKKPAGCMLVLSVFSPEGRQDLRQLSALASEEIKYRLLTINDVAEISVLGGQKPEIRIIIDPDKMAVYGLRVNDVVQAVREQNADSQPMGPAAGKLPAQVEQLPARAKDYGNVALKNKGGRAVWLKDLARIEDGADERHDYACVNGKPAVALAIRPVPEANLAALRTALEKILAGLRPRLPSGVEMHAMFMLDANRAGEGRSAELLLVDAGMSPGMAPHRLHETLQRWEQELRGEKSVRDVLLLSDNPLDRFGGRACILVRLAPCDKVPAGREPVVEAIRARLGAPGIVPRLLELSDPQQFARRGWPVDLAVHGPDADKVRDLTGMSVRRLQESEKLTSLWFSSESDPAPQLSIDINRAAAAKHGVRVSDISETLQVALGQQVIEQGTAGGTRVQVRLGDRRRLAAATDIKTLLVSSAEGRLVPLSMLANVRQVASLAAVNRFNGQPMVEITAAPAPGVSLVEARALCEAVVEGARKQLKLPEGYRLTWLAPMP